MDTMPNLPVLLLLDRSLHAGTADLHPSVDPLHNAMRTTPAPTANRRLLRGPSCLLRPLRPRP